MPAAFLPGDRLCQILKSHAPNAAKSFLSLNANRTIIASAVSAIPSVASLAGMRAGRTLAIQKERRAAPTANDSRSSAISAANLTAFLSNHNRGDPSCAPTVSRPAAPRIDNQPNLDAAVGSQALEVCVPCGGRYNNQFKVIYGSFDAETWARRISLCHTVRAFGIVSQAMAVIIAVRTPSNSEKSLV